MAKTAPSSTSVASASTSTPAAAAPAAAAPAAKVVKAKAAASPAPAAAPAAAAAPAKSVETVVSVDAAADPAVAVEVEGSVSAALYTSVLSKLQSTQSLIASIRAEVNELKRQHARELRVANKANKRRKTNANRAPSGFVKPTLISNELAAFLGKPEGSVLARTEVTREVNAYIRSQKLQDKDNGRKINPDAKLLKLLKLKKGDELTYFNLQKYMAAHFAKSTPAVAVAASPAPTAAGAAVKA
jgi:chromatin remodeling complex protein RSC6